MFNRCRLFLSEPVKFSNTISNDLRSPDPIIAQRAFQINKTVQVLHDGGIVFSSDEIYTFLESQQANPPAIPKLVHFF